MRLRVAVLSLALLVPAPPAMASRPSEGHVGPGSPTVHWAGATFVAAAAENDGCFDESGRPRTNPPTTGADACDLFTLHVDLDSGYWTHRDGAVVIILDGFVGHIDLRVYERNPDGTRGRLAGASEGLSIDQVVKVDEPSGTYYVVAEPRLVGLSSYTGFARLDSQSGPDLRPYLRNISPKIPGVDVYTSTLYHERIPAPDLVPLDAWVVVPDIEGPVPLVLEITPYYAGGPPFALDGRHQLGRVADELVPRGYAYGVVSVRGTGNSGGCFTIGGPVEARDSAAVIEHLAAKQWSNGSVGLIGVSYPGTTPQDVWVEAPPSLKTIVPISGISDLYKYNFVNGVPIVPQGFAFNTYYLQSTSLNNGPGAVRDPVSAPGAIAGEACTDQVEVQEGGVSSTLDGNKDAYWLARDFLAELRASSGRPRASVFYIHGLEDWNVKPHHMEGWLEAVQGTGVPFKAWLGQWGHSYPRRPDWWTVMTAWFDQALKLRTTGILEVPAVQVQDDSEAWRHEAAWPPVAERLVIPYGSAAYDDRDGRAELVSEPVNEDLHLAGLPRFEAQVTASGHRASLLLTLYERTAEGDRPINFAALSLNHAASLERGEPSIAGRAQHVGLNFFPQDDVVRAGSRIVLVAAANLERSPVSLQPVSTGSTITIEGVALTLPVDRSIVPETQG